MPAVSVQAPHSPKSGRSKRRKVLFAVGFLLVAGMGFFWWENRAVGTATATVIVRNELTQLPVSGITVTLDDPDGYLIRVPGLFSDRVRNPFRQRFESVTGDDGSVTFRYPIYGHSNSQFRPGLLMPLPSGLTLKKVDEPFSANKEITFWLGPVSADQSGQTSAVSP